MIITIIGTIAAILTTTAMFPQAIRIIRTRDVHSISLLMYSTHTVGLFFWLTYGIMLNEWPMIMANIIGIIPASSILILKIKLGAQVKAKPNK